MHSEKTVGKSWIEALESNSSYRSFIENLAISIKRVSRDGRVPWIRMETLYLSKFLLERISNQLNTEILGLKAVSDDAFRDLDRVGKKLIESTGGFVIDENIELQNLEQMLSNLEYENVDKVWHEKEFSVLGDVVSIWPMGFDRPVRVEFFGTELESIVIIDPETRRTVKEINELRLFNINKDFLDKSDLEFMRLGVRENKQLPIPVILSDTSPLSGDFEFDTELYKVDFKSTSWDTNEVGKTLDRKGQVLFVINHNLDKAQQISNKYSDIRIFEEDFPEGFESKSLNLKVLTDQELWGTVKLNSRSRSNKYDNMLLDEISPGDYVVHEDHGVGIYSGLKELERNTKFSKYLEIKYAEKDRLLVPIPQIRKITKYIGAAKKQPKLTRLKGGHWTRVKNRVKKSVKKLAAELLRLYAMRSMAEAKNSDFDNKAVKEFEDTFEFVETEDQLRAVKEVYGDLEGSKPMDRLLVGDVGFGKTEVAMRAAFKMVTAGKQVAVLAPTTILVEQHYHVFHERMKDFGVEVAALSRFLSKEQAKKTVSQVQEGKVDVIIGTHRLLSNDIQFKNLGLLVIDEEQKFGVAQKEKLKRKRVDTHVLSMSATPIPRTLNMALSGVKDISVITTPPLGRKPIKNYVKKFEWKEVARAIKKEKNRGGQVYFVHNRVSSLNHIKQRLEQEIPDLKVAVGHGQMPGEQLSKVMRDFNNKVYDVLLCTTIIENGLDLPNVNTLIIDRAEMFGLSQLYQLRGRIGRGEKQAFAYFFYYGVGDGDSAGLKRGIKERVSAQKEGRREDAKKPLWQAARKRLDAIRDLEDLGSGFGLARRDLEIRGAGSFLGRRQHGNVSSVGFSLYCRLLSEMVEKLKKEM